MSKKSKKNRKKNQLTKKEIDAMVQEVLEEAAREAAEAKAAESAVSADEAAVAMAAAAETVTPAEVIAEAVEETVSEPQDVTDTIEEPEEAEPDTTAEITAEPEPEAAEQEPETVSPEPEVVEETAGEAVKAEEPAEDDYVLPNVDENAPDPSGSKSVFLTVKDDGKLAIAANKDGDIIFEENVIPPKPSFFKRFRTAIIMLIAMLLVVAASFAYDYLLPKEVTVVINSLEQSRTITQKVAAYDVGEALDKMGIKVSPIDQVLPYFTERVESGMTVNINKHLEALATVAGKPKSIVMIPGTVKDNLEFNEIEYDKDDLISPALDDLMTSTTKIVVKDFVKVVKQKKKTIPSSSRIVLDPSLSSGTRLSTEAVDGVGLYTYTTTYIDGVDQGTEEKFTKWITEPQDDEIRLGTSLTGQSGEVYIINSFVSNTTAYYMGDKAYGAAGTHCHYGTCAVDPSVVPYCSILWVAGYGLAVANHCGGAIIGTNLDLYMRSTEECFSWGRRYVQAYVLGWA